MRLFILSLACLIGLSGCYVLNQEHYSDIVSIDARLAKLQAEDHKLAARIAALGPVEHALRKEFAAEIKQQSASIRHPSAHVVGMSMQEPLLFASGSADISKQGNSLLGRLATVLRKAPDEAVFRIVGHTDSMPLNKALQSGFIDNWGLSTARAAAVARTLVWNKKFDERRIRIEGRAYHAPVAANDSATNMAKNRRVEIFIELVK